MHDSGFVRGLENLECARISLLEFKTLKVPEFAKLALKSLEFNIYLLHSLHNYGISEVSNGINIASKHLKSLELYNLKGTRTLTTSKCISSTGSHSTPMSYVLCNRSLTLNLFNVRCFVAVWFSNSHGENVIHQNKLIMAPLKAMN